MQILNLDLATETLKVQLTKEEADSIIKWHREVLYASTFDSPESIKNYHEAVQSGKVDIDVPSQHLTLKNAWCINVRQEGDFYYGDFTFDKIERLL